MLMFFVICLYRTYHCTGIIRILTTGRPKILPKNGEKKTWNTFNENMFSNPLKSSMGTLGRYLYLEKKLLKLSIFVMMMMWFMYWASVLHIRIRRIHIISLDPDPYQKLSWIRIHMKTIENRKSATTKNRDLIFLRPTLFVWLFIDKWRSVI